MDDQYTRKNSLRILEDIRGIITRPWTLMCICGGQTHVVVKHEIDRAFPEKLKLVHGLGCPVCVTPVETIDKALFVANTPGTILCTPGEMLRAPGSRSSLFEARANGADVRVIYSPLDAVSIACKHPDAEVVLFSAGFENGAPPTAVALFRAHEAQLRNFSLLGGYMRLSAAIEAVLESPETAVHGFLAAGHTATVSGYSEYEPLARRHNTPIVLTGLDPLDILEAAYRCVRALENGRANVECTSSCAAPRTGDQATQTMIESVFESASCKWRGLGEVPFGGLRLRNRFAAFNAENRFDIADITAPEPANCIGRSILEGKNEPQDCPCFDGACTPDHPVGPSMGSAKGVCAAHYHYRREGGS